jgi:hypothetical protein
LPWKLPKNSPKSHHLVLRTWFMWCI